MSGETCTVDRILGQHLSVGDKLLILDTCAHSTLLPRSSHTGLSTSVVHSGAFIAWSDVPVTSAGGEYRLCWCAASFNTCSSTEHFVTDEGALTLIGPTPLFRDRTCVSGQTCESEASWRTSWNGFVPEPSPLPCALWSHHEDRGWMLYSHGDAKQKVDNA